MDILHTILWFFYFQEKNLFEIAKSSIGRLYTFSAAVNKCSPLYNINLLLKMHFCDQVSLVLSTQFENNSVCSYVNCNVVSSTGKNRLLPKVVNILGKLWKTEFSLNITNIVIFYFQEYSNFRNI